MRSYFFQRAVQHRLFSPVLEHNHCIVVCQTVLTEFGGAVLHVRLAIASVRRLWLAGILCMHRRSSSSSCGDYWFVRRRHCSSNGRCQRPYSASSSTDVPSRTDFIALNNRYPLNGGQSVNLWISQERGRGASAVCWCINRLVVNFLRVCEISE